MCRFQIDCQVRWKWEAINYKFYCFSWVSRKSSSFNSFNFLVDNELTKIWNNSWLISGKMGSDNNCNNYYNIDQSSVSSPYYQTLGSQNGSSQESLVKSVNNEWINERNSETNNSGQKHDQEADDHHEKNNRDNSEMPSSRNTKSYNNLSHQHLHMSAPQWSFPGALGNSYQRFYGENHYGIVLTPNVSQQGSLASTPSSSLHSLNSENASQAHHIHHMQTSQHLKKIYYQGLKMFYIWWIELLFDFNCTAPKQFQ